MATSALIYRQYRSRIAQQGARCQSTVNLASPDRVQCCTELVEQPICPLEFSKFFGHDARCPNGVRPMPGIDESKTFQALKIALLTISDTRTRENDTSGDALEELVRRDGHSVAARLICSDDQETIVQQLKAWTGSPDVDVIISTGGTGLTGRDVTPEAFAEVCDKEIPGFGELFRMLSYEKIGTSTIQSRAVGGVANGTYLFALPGSTNACRDGWELILRHQLDVRYRPCNFAQILDRLKEGS